MNPSLFGRARSLAASLYLAAAWPQARVATSHGCMESQETLSRATMEALAFTDLDALQRILELARLPTSRFGDGSHALHAFEQGLDRFMGEHRHGSAFHAEMVACTCAMASAHPGSALAHYLHAKALFNRSRQLAGNGGDDRLPHEAREQFLRLSKAAADHLERHAKVALREPLAHKLLVAIGRSLGWSFESQWRTAQAGLDIDPEYDGIYLELLTGLLAGSGGTPAMVESFIDKVAERAGARRGPGMSARLRRAAGAHLQVSLSHDSQVQWPPMKRRA